MQGRTGDWGEVVTRYPYENVGMDHLLSMELFDIEKQPYLRTSGLAHFMRKVLMKAFIIDSFYLVLRDFFSQILFFENLIMP